MLPSSEGFLADDLGPDVNLQGMHNSDLVEIHHAAIIRGVPCRRLGTGCESAVHVQFLAYNECIIREVPCR